MTCAPQARSAATISSCVASGSSPRRKPCSPAVSMCGATPSRTAPFITLMPVGGTCGQNTRVLFGGRKIASARSAPTLRASTSTAMTKAMSAVR